MIEETATVIAINNRRVTVKSQIKSTCHSCEQQNDCGSGQVAKAISHKALISDLETDIPLTIGDEVVIGIPEGNILTSAVQVYLWPLLGLIIGASLGQLVLVEQLQWHEVSGLILASTLAFCGFKLAQKQQSQTEVQASLQPKLLRRCPKTISVTQL
ncbi:SoxR reducing system RseC family protein [Thalassotalea aquiviva]|uniref:SoxR reducing system RseC family protein n=1 Tax=Thalassotalea aquiviva TaxID=3242415 RepID=UPI00352B04F3